MNRPPLHQPSSDENGWVRFIAGFGYALHGLWYAMRTQRNVRVHTGATVLAIIVGLLLHLSPVEFALIFVAITGVFVSEMLNTVAELCIDLSTPQYHPLAKTAKDVAAGAVLLNAILAVIIGLLVFGPHLLTLLQHR